MTDAKIRQVRGFGGKVHRGFNGALGKVWGGRKGIVRTVKGFLDNGQTLWVAGHSLGAALAALAVTASGKEGLVINGLYTFGMPRVGNKAFARRFDKKFRRRTFRFVNNNDLVTRIPLGVLQYKHVGRLMYLDHRGRLRSGIGLGRKILDRIRGRIDDFLKPGTDGFKDHAMGRYIKAIKSNM
jgi:triacylglycerol lipase